MSHCEKFLLFQATLKYTGSVVSGKTKLKCSFSLIYTTEALDLKKSKISCKPKNKKAVKILDYEIEDPPCVFILSMTITEGKGNLKWANIKCKEKTTEMQTPPPTPTPAPPITTPASPSPTISPSPTTTCCKERIFEQSNYILVGQMFSFFLERHYYQIPVDARCAHFQTQSQATSFTCLS